ncbi:MAG: DUF4097 family beta strand repeat-containing protein [Pyrinomonadaceae bacterium]
MFAAFTLLAYAQPSMPATPDPLDEDATKLAELFGGDTSEKFIAVDKDVNLSLCVTQGNLKINGWSRDEVRVFVKHGAKFGFAVQLKSSKSGLPALLKITGLETKGKYSIAGECIWGDEIEIDVPVNSIVNIKGKETKTTIDTVRKTSVDTIGGDIILRNVGGGIKASTGQGDITVEDSEGAMMLESTTGNILVFNARPGEIGDMFKARTNGGNISLQNMEHRQIEANSISGSVFYSGTILNGGTYLLGTSNGSLKLSIPADTSCLVMASYGFGTFDAELPLKLLTENIAEGPVKSQTVALGAGAKDTTVKLTTNSGSIVIKRL